MPASLNLTIRPLEHEDRIPVVELDESLTGTSRGDYWGQVLDSLAREAGGIGLVAVDAEGLRGYLFGELRAFEFGSERCGWILALGVQPGTTRQGVASALVDEARRRFRALGVRYVRTMVQRTDVPLLSLFRSQSFVGGPFVQLELDISGDPIAGATTSKDRQTVPPGPTQEN